MRSRSVALLVALLTLPFSPSASSAAAPALPESLAPSCPATAKVVGLGAACRQPSGLLEVFAPDGVSVGTTHGVDPIVPHDLLPRTASDAGPSPAHCISDPLAFPYHARVIYARAFDDEDLYAAKVESIRGAVEGGLGYLAEASIAGGATSGSVHVRCTTGGQIIVENVVLPTARADADFSTVSRDLTVLGYNDLKVKHWVHYDDRDACACGGTGNLYGDDSLSAGNANNGNGTSPMFAVVWDRVTAYRTWLHELGHNLGAVQNSAPRTSGAGHCIDGLDVMCYNDGGPNTASYSNGVCDVQVFDCGKNDYFNLQPTPGSYLATKWNLGSRLNRYLWLTGVPTISVIDPAPGRIYAAGCAASTPSLPIAGPTSETQSGIVVGDVCVRIDVLDAPATSVRVYVDNVLRATATSPESVAANGTQRWTIQAPHGTSCCFRIVRIDAVGANGFVSTASARIVPLG